MASRRKEITRMAGKDINISVTKDESNPIPDILTTLCTGGVYGLLGGCEHKDYEATVTVGNREYSASGRTYDEAVDAAKDKAGID
jgi:hypothetical protein